MLQEMQPIRTLEPGDRFQYLPRNETFRVTAKDDETLTYQSEDVQNSSRLVTRSGWKVWKL